MSVSKSPARRPPSWVKSAFAAMVLALCAPGIALAQITEETLPAEEMPAAAATPTAIPGASPAAAPGETPAETPVPVASPSPSPQPAAAAPATPGLPPLTSSGQPGTAQATPSEPPPFDLGSSTTLQISEAPLTSLIDNAPTPARAASMRLTEQARQEISARKASDAIRSLTHALSIDSSNPYAYFYVGRAYFLKKDCHQALTFLQRAEIGFASDQPWLGETLSFEGACYEQSGQTADAITAYKRALDSAPSNLMARVGYERLATYEQPDSDAFQGAQTPPESEAPPPPEMPPPAGAPSESAPSAPGPSDY